MNMSETGGNSRKHMEGGEVAARQTSERICVPSYPDHSIVIIHSFLYVFAWCIVIYRVAHEMSHH